MTTTNITYKASVFTLGIYILIAILSPFIAGDRPIYCNVDGRHSFPFLNKSIVTANVDEKCIMPMIPYSGGYSDKEKRYGMSPFAESQNGDVGNKHWLGTDKLGRDVAAGMVRGCGIALKIGFLSVLFSFIIGVSLGLAAGYFQDKGIKSNVISVILYIAGSISVGYMLWMQFVIFYQSWWSFLILFGLLLIVLKVLGHWISGLITSKSVTIPLDTIIVKLIEVRKSFPGLFLLLALVSLFSLPSVWNIVFIIALLSWADFARLARGDTLSVSSENYITSVKMLGIPDNQIIFRHILPNILPTLIVAICFSIGSAVILESTLSFLGIGLPVETVSWGKMMAEGRNMQYWWLVVFPGLAIFILVLCLNNIANHWQKSNFQIPE